MHQRTYPVLESGDVVSLSENPAHRGLLRTLAPMLVAAQEAQNVTEFTVVEVGPSRTVVRHEDTCYSNDSVAPERCRNCDGLEVTFQTRIWIAAHYETFVRRKNKKGEVRTVLEERYASSFRTGSRPGALLTSELLALEPVETPSEGQS